MTSPERSETNLTLYEREAYLEALASSEDGVIPPELEEEFRLDIQQAVRDVKEKRDGVAAYLLKLMIEAAKAEGAIAVQLEELQRLQSRKERFENAANRLKDYVLGVIREFGKDEKTERYKVLEGNTATLKANRVPASVEIVDESKVPARYKSATVKLKPDEYAAVDEMLRYLRTLKRVPDAVGAGIMVLQGALQTAQLYTSKTAVGDALKSACQKCMGAQAIDGSPVECIVCNSTGRQLVPGAKLVEDKLRLVVS